MYFIAYSSRDYKDSPAVYKGVDGETTVVDRVMLCSDTDEKLIIKCIIRHTRRPEVCPFFLLNSVDFISRVECKIRNSCL